MDEDSNLETRDATPIRCCSLLSASPLPLCLRKSYVENHPILFRSHLVTCADVFFWGGVADFYLFVSKTGFFYVARAVLELSL